jgi:hypothetical protein
MMYEKIHRIKSAHRSDLWGVNWKFAGTAPILTYLYDWIIGLDGKWLLLATTVPTRANPANDAAAEQATITNIPPRPYQSHE